MKKELNGNWNSISADAFQGNTIVVTISIYNTNLPSLPAGLFSGLSSLQTISIDSNPALTSLPVGLFNESLSSLTSLTISGNNLLTQLSPNLFAGLNSVTNLNLGNSGYNRFTTLQNGVFNGLTSITTFQIYNWPELTTIEAGAFSGFTKMNHETYGNYPNIYITSNPKLTTIQPQAFAGLKLFHLQVEGNPLWVPAANTFSGVYTRELDIRTSAAISQFPSYTFNNSVVLNYLSIYNNPSLTTLVANTFTGSTISNLYIQYNPALTTILANTFDKINALGTTLILYNDVLSTIEVGAFGTYSSPTLQTLSIIGCPKIATFPLGVFSTSVSSLVSLTLSNLATLSTLPPGLFTNLTSLTSFTLRESYQLKVLQAGVFRGLSSVTNFDLGNSGANAFTILKKGVFEGLTSLVTFSIYSWNDLVTIEDEVFSDFIKMNHPAYSNYPTIYFSYNPKLATIGKNIFKDIKVYRIQFDNNPALVLQTNTFNSTYVQDLQLQSLNNMTELTPFLFNGATVYGTLGIFTMSSMINIPANAFSGSTVSAISLQNNYVLQNISAFAFNNITNLRTLNFYSNPLLAYISKDSFFSVAGNPVFTTLTLSYNAMQTLPLGVFNGLETMTTLYISNNDKLSSLPPGLFSNLTLLTSFVLNGNFQLKVLQPGTFLGLQSVTSIDLGNNYNGFTILQRGVFQGLTSLNSISISNWNNLETIEAGVFSDLTRMNHNLYSNYPSIYINNNPVLTSIEQNAFNGLSFYSLELNNNPVLALPVNVFNGSTSIYLYLRALQNMTQLPSYLFAGSIVNTLTIHYMGGLRTLLPYTFANCSVSSIFIQYNSVLASLSPLTFDKSSGIVTLYIRLNDVLWDIQPNVFGNLSSIQNLYITDNSNLTAINKGLFTAGVSTLTTLSISGLPITTLPVGGFINLTSVVNFYFSNNYQLTVIPSGALLGLSSVTSMDLNYNKIQTLQKGVFKGLDSLLNLQIYNWIELVSIEEGAFHDFPKMDYNNNYGSIYISYNPKLSKLDKNLFAVIRPYHIQIEYNPLLRLNETNIFNGTNTRELDIRGLDGVTTILPKTFSGLVIVNYLTLNYLSGLVSIASDAFTGSSIPNLYVQYNPVLATLSPLAFNNITNSYSVYIQGNNALWDISPNVFGSLTGVYSLSINDNANLSSIPFGVFGGRLSLLQSLTMVRNTKLITLSPGIFSNLTSLVNLYLYGNMNWKVLEPGVFIGLESLTNLDLGSYGNNAFTSLKKGVFAGLTRLTSISISGWSQLETIEDGVFSDLTRFNYTRYGEYSSIYIASNPLLTTISNNAFANIYPYRIQLDDNKVLTLNTGVFDNVITREIVLRQLHRINRFDSFLFATTKVLSYMSIEFMSNLTDFLPNTFYGLEVPILYIQYNPILTSFASSTFSGIKNLNTIYMYSNPSLNVFPAGLFYGLFSLQSFSVEKKYFTPIPPLSTYLSSNGNIYNCHPSCSTCFGPSSLECCPFGCNRCLTNSSCYENSKC